MHALRSAVRTACVFAVALVTAAPAFAAGSWHLQPSANPSADDQLGAVIAVSPNDVWSIGSQYAANGSFHPLIENFDGASWQAVPFPEPTGVRYDVLSGLSATAPSDIWTVGFSRFGYTKTFVRPLAEHYDGTSWSITQAPSPTSSTQLSGFNAVTAVSPTDVWAVGSAGPGNQQAATLVEHFDGTGWQIVPSPNRTTDNGLAGVAGTGGRLWATGASFPTNSSNSQTLVETYP